MQVYWWIGDGLPHGGGRKARDTMDKHSAAEHRAVRDLEMVGAPVPGERPLVTTPDPHSDTVEPYTREYYRFSRRGFHIDYFDAAEPPPQRRLPLLMSAEVGRSIHHLQAVVRQGGVTQFTVAQDVVGPGARFWAEPTTKGLDGALRREVVRLIRTSEGRPGGSYRLDPQT